MGGADAGGGLGTVDDNHRRLAKQGVPGFELPAETPVPKEMAHLLVWYTDLRNRAPRGFGYEPVTWEAIAAYRDFLARADIEMDSFDEDMLCRTDNLWMTAQSTTVVKEPDDPPVRPAGARPSFAAPPDSP